MKQKLKLKLWRTSCTVHMQILEQEGIDKSLSRRIKTSGGNAMGDDYIEIRGYNHRYDNDIENHRFDTEQEATDYINKVVSWLDDVFPVREPKQGDMVNVKQHEDDEWEERMYVSSFVNKNTGKTRYICVHKGSENYFIKGDDCSIIGWLYMKSASSNWNPETGIYEAEMETL